MVLEYYNRKKISDIEYASTVCGTKKRIICKHIVTTYFNVVPNSAKVFESEQNRLHEEYEEYKNEEKWQQLVAKLPWGHNLLLIEKLKDKKLRKIYIEAALNNGWS